MATNSDASSPTHVEATRGPWIGIDVGGHRKGFDAAALRRDGSQWQLELEKFDRDDAVASAAAWIARFEPARVAIDSPAGWAGDGQRSRTCERDFTDAKICGIRYTPSQRSAEQRTDRYYEWIEHGLELQRALRDEGINVIECFPTASWTAWHGKKGTASRATWSKNAMDQITAGMVAGVSTASNQDKRDAVAAALTAFQAERADVKTFGTLTVPTRHSRPLGI